MCLSVPRIIFTKIPKIYHQSTNSFPPVLFVLYLVLLFKGLPTALLGTYLYSIVLKGYIFFFPLTVTSTVFFYP